MATHREEAMRRTGTAAAVLALSLAFPSAAHAADRYVSRPITLPQLDFAFNAGMGIGHSETGGPTPANHTGAGLNLEGAVGLTSHLELGLRLGLRGGVEARTVGADRYGRLYDTETYGTGGDTLANPEFRITGALLNAEVVEIALEGRVVLPFEGGTRFGGAFGAPFLFHLARFVRLDTGAYIITFFRDPFRPAFSIPARLWFQVSDRVWLGPISALHHVPATNDVDIALGFGLGYQITSFLDFKTQFLFPSVNHTTTSFGFGAGLEIRIE